MGQSLKQIAIPGWIFILLGNFRSIWDHCDIYQPPAFAVHDAGRRIHAIRMRFRSS